MSDKEVRVRITGDISDLLNKLERVKDAFNDIGKDDINSKGVNDFIDNLQRAQDEIELIETSLDEVIGTTKKFDDNSFSDMADEFSDANRQVNDLSDSFKELNEAIGDIDTRAFENLNDSMQEIADLDKYIDSFNFDDMTESIRESEDALREFYNTQEKAFDSENNGFVDSMETITELGHEAADIYQQIAEQVEEINMDATLDSNKSDSNRFDSLKEGIISGAVAGQTMKSSMEGVADALDSVSAAFKEFGNADTTLEKKVDAFHKLTPAIEEASDEIERLKKEEQSLKGLDGILKGALNYDEHADDIRTAIEETTDAKEDLIEKTKELKKIRSEAGTEFKKYAGWYDSLSAKVKEFVEDEENGVFIREKVAKSFKEVTDAMKDMYKFNDEGSVHDMVNAKDELSSSINAIVNLRGEIGRVKKEMKELQDIMYELGPSNKLYKDMKQYMDEAEKIEKEIAKVYGDDWLNKDFSQEDAFIQKYIKNMENLYKICKKIEDEKFSIYAHADSAEREYMNKLGPELEEYNKELWKEEKAYQRVKDRIDNLIKSYESMNKAVNRVNDSGADDLLDNISKKADDAAKSVSLVDFDVLKKGLDTLGADIEDKAEKLIRFQQVNKELNDEMKKTVGSFKGQGNAIKDYADNAGYAIEVIKPLLEGTKLLSSEGFNIIGNDKNLEKKLEQQEQLFRDNIEVIEEYMRVLKDSGSEISKSFFDDSGKFDADKFLKNIETFGKPMNQLTMQMESYKRQILENLKHEKESIESTRELARANKESAQSALEVAQAVEKQAAARKKAASEAEQMARTELKYADTAEESAQAARKLEDAISESENAYKNHEQALKDLAQAQKEYAEASEKLSNVDRDRVKHGKELVEQYNDQAKALRKMGADIKDITKGDIQDFDKSLGSLFDDIFPDDTPNKLSDFVEDIKAAFSEFKNLEFGNAFDIFKDIGKGLFDKLPGSLKAAVATVTALTVATKKLYDIGKQNFFEGLSNIGNKLQPVWEAVKNIGDEVRDAFENITDTQIDLGSLMELGPNFEYNMQKVGAIAGSNKRQLEELTKTAEVLGGTTQYTASDVAEAFQFMAMAGYDTEEMLSSINGTLALSIASGTSLAETTDIVTDYMTALGLEANSTSDFVDKLAATVTSSNTTVEKYGLSMKNVASQAGALGINMTDLSTAIGLQANAGVKGAKAGTALKNVLANMAAPTKTQEKALKELGFTADKTGSYFKTTADGAVDLEATVKQLMTATDKMTKSQKAAVLAQLAGREALPGLMALLSQGAEGWDELSNTIENSTGKVQYWNECMSLAGKSGKEATKAIENMKTVFAEVETEALNAGLSSEELSHAIAILGDDGKVTSDNIRGLIDVIDSMNTATGKTEKKWRALDAAGDDLVNTGYDYDATIAKITADTTGLSQATKESIKSKLNENMTYEEANAVLKEYGITAERVSFSTLSYADKLEYLRDNLKGCSDEYIKSQLANLGLADSFDEVKEIVSMTDEEFAAYKKNLETVKGMAEQLAEAMDETTKSSLLNLASAIENVAITAFNKIKPALKGAVDAINEFFDTWHNGDKNVFTFDGLEMAFVNLAGKIIEQKGKIQQAVADLFSGLDRFINGGTLDNILNIGTHLVDSICKGIQQAKDNGSLDRAIDGAIKKICTWIETNAPQIEEAGLTIIESLKDGMLNNEAEISSALDSLCGVINSWAASSGELKAAATTFADTFISAAGEAIVNKGSNKVNEWLGPLVDLLNPDMQDYYKEGGTKQLTDQEKFFAHNAKGGFLVDWIKGGIQKAKEWLFGESYAAELGEEVGTQVTEGYNNKLVEGKEKTNATANEIGTGISEGIGNALSSMDVAQLQLLQTEMTNLQTATATVATGMATSFTTIQNTARTSFMGFANIVRNQMLNVSNIIRNQLLNCTNIVRNQALNMSNIFRNQFVNMTNIVRNQALNMANIIRNQMLNMTNIVRNQALNMSNIFRNQFVNMANIVRNQMVNVANIVRNQMVNCANIVRNQCVNMANIFRNQFVSMANVARNQMVNVSNIIRNQAISWSNVIRNQVTNARNTFTQQMISMASVARTQMVNVSNIVRNQATQWASVVRSQAANMKSAFTSAFSGLSSIAASQMAKCLSVVRSYMSQIRAATAQKMTMSFSVNRTITTTNVTKTKTVAASAAYAMRAVNDSMFALSVPSVASVNSSNIGNSSGIDIHGNTSGNLSLEVPLYIDNREVARATAKYTQEELAKLSKRSNRKQGI